jgi:hypothetical protein
VGVLELFGHGAGAMISRAAISSLLMPSETEQRVAPRVNIAGSLKWSVNRMLCGSLSEDQGFVA